MVTAIIMSLIFTPAFYVVMQKLSEYKRNPEQSSLPDV
jgi:hypothetical protein